MSSSTFEVSFGDELTYHKNNLPSHSRKYIRFDEEQEQDENTTTTTTTTTTTSTTTTTNTLSLPTDKQQLIQTIQESIIGDNEMFKSPFGFRKVTYCDYVASGRSLSFIEDYIQSQVLTLYANTHTTTSITGHQSTLFRYESRQLLMNAMNASKKDVLIFTGSGATSASNKLVHLLGLSKQKSSTSTIDDNENNENSENQPIVFVGPYEHHSNLLPWRESNAKIVSIREDGQLGGQIDISHLRSELVKYSNGKRMIIGAFSAASNITGILTDTDTITALLHVYGGYAIWDYACAAPYVKIDMNVSKQLYGVSCHKDAIFFSTHKFVGGPSTPGVLLVKKHMFKNTLVPTQPGGDTVFFVTDQDHRYLKKPHEREEGGTPDVVGAVRAGLVFQLKSAVGEEYIEQLEQELYQKAMNSFSQNPNLIILGSTTAAAAATATDSGSLKKLPIFSFLVQFKNKYILHYNFVSTLLNDLFGIQSRGGCACAGPYSLKLLGIQYDMAKKIESALLKDDDYEFLRPGFSRINLNYFFNSDTTDYVIEAVNWVANHGWKLMPYYTFYPDTGEWKHYLNKKTANNRRWIHNISYTNGTMQYRHQVNQRIPLNKYKKEYEKYMREAYQILDKALDEFEANSLFRAASSWRKSTTSDDENGGDDPLHMQDLLGSNTTREDSPYKGGGFQVPDQKLLLSNDSEVEALRWFVYPSEVLHYLREGHLLKAEQVFERPCPFRPIVYGSLSNTNAASQQQQQPTTTTDAEEEEEEQTQEKNDSLSQEKQDNVIVVEADEEEQESSLLMGLGLGGGDDDSDYDSDETEEEKQKREAREQEYLRAHLWPKIPVKKIMAPVKRAVMEFGMIQDGDRLLLGLSGGKDSLTLLHVLHTLQTNSNLPFKFEFGACTVDPQTDAYDPSPLINYCKQLGVPYYFESQNIIETAKTCQATSICSWCSRMKRGILYNVARRNGYNVLVLGQHLDDLAESFIMSILHNGYLRTMKANYLIDEGDLRVIRPLTYVREKELKKFAREHLLPIINENCPACFEMPKERARVKTLLSNQEHLFPDLFHSLETAMRPLMDNTLDRLVGADHKKYKSNPKNKWPAKNATNNSNNSNKIKKKTSSSENEENNEATETIIPAAKTTTVPGPSVTSNKVLGKKSGTKKRQQQRVVWPNITNADVVVAQDVNSMLANIDTSVLEQELARRRSLQQQQQQ